MKNYYYLLIISFIALSQRAVSQETVILPGILQVEDELRPLPPQQIQMEDYLDHYIRLSIDNWNKGDLPYDEFVNFFREGRPQFALGEMWGKAVRSGAMFYRYTRDDELKKILDNTVEDLLSTQRANGSISCVEIENQPDGSELWERKYVMLGLEDYYQWVNRDPKVLEALKKQADNIMELIGPAPKTEIVDVGWSAVNIGYEECHIESSSLLEPFMRLYEWTGDHRYLDFATYIIETGGTKHYNIFQMTLDNVPPYQMAGHYPKAYEMLSIFEGLAEYYRVTGKEEIKQMIINMYHNVRKNEITIIGNGGSDQPYHPYVMGEAWGNTAWEQTNPDIERMMETCVGITWMKFCSQILRLTGDPSTVDEIEKYVYNGLIGAMKPSGDGFSYVNLLNGCKVNGQGWGWHFDEKHVTCCNLNGPMGLAYIPFVAAMESNKGIALNLYNKAAISFSTPSKQQASLDIITDYPVNGKIDFALTIPQNEKFEIKLRIPSWSKKTDLKINGKRVKVSPGQYANILRKWHNGDKIELCLDMRCRVMDAPKGNNRAGDNFQALIRGPIVLARDENIDSDYDKPVTLLTGKDEYVKAIPVLPSSPCTKLQFMIPTREGKYIQVVDYASVNNWDNGKHVCTWLPK